MSPAREGIIVDTHNAQEYRVAYTDKLKRQEPHSSTGLAPA